MLVRNSLGYAEVTNDPISMVSHPKGSFPPPITCPVQVGGLCHTGPAQSEQNLSGTLLIL